MIVMTVLIWAECVAGYALYYVRSRLALPRLEGYETEWVWQLMFFGIKELPWLVLTLGALVLVELRFFKANK